MKQLSVPLWLEFSACILVVLVLSNALTLYVAEQRRLSAVRTEKFRAVEMRIEAFADLYRRVPVEGRGQLLNLASARHEKLAVSKVPRVAAGSVRDARVEARLRQVLGLDAAADVRVSKRGRPELSLVEGLHSRQQERFSVAVLIAPGEWLNGDFYWPIGESLLPGIMFSGLVSAVLLVLLSLWIARRLAVPLMELASAADRLQQGKSIVPLKAHGPKALQATLASFNHMAQRMVPLVDSQRMVLASVGHDLRTPISSLRLQSEFIDDDGLRQSFAGSLDELQSLTEAALQVSRDGVSHEMPRCVDVAALVESLCADLTDLGDPVACSVAGSIEVSCRPNEIRRAVRNLVDNAVKYGGAAAVSFIEGPDMIGVVVADPGPGVPPDKIEEAFSPFVRVGDTGKPGHGLGLTLSRAIARAHGGDVRLANLVDGGLTATFTMRRS